MGGRGGVAGVDSWLAQTLVAWPSPSGALLLAVTAPAQRRISAYDNALVALYLTRTARRAEAGRLLAAWAGLQAADGSVPFSFVLPAPDPSATYVRSGAAAWLGYAAVDYLDAAPDGPERDAIVRLAHRLAAYLLAHQVTAPGDPRDGLLRGGAGTFRYDVANRNVRESFVPGELDWASTEHNIDAFFFFGRLARLVGRSEYEHAAQRIGAALLARAWMSDGGQLARGIGPSGVDAQFALDCASWGALFLLSIGERAKADTALAVAAGRYASADPKTGASGHRPYAHAPLLANRNLAQHYADKVPVNEWDRVDAVWPEGTAGVALAAWRLGDRQSAERYLQRLEPLRTSDGWLPTLTREVPFEFDTHPSVAATVWVELVRLELARPPQAQTFLAALQGHDDGARGISAPRSTAPSSPP